MTAPRSLYRLTALALAVGALWSVAARADEVAERQSMDAFTSIEDGQPGDPGEFELRVDFGWSDLGNDDDEHHYFGIFRNHHLHHGLHHWFRPDDDDYGDDDDTIFEGEYELKYTGKGSPFAENMKLSLEQGAVLGDGSVEGNGGIELSWQQRWVAEDGPRPTLATLLTVRLPTGDDSEGTDVTLTGILDKDIGPGTAYFSAWITKAGGDDDVRDTQWGTQLGYKWRVNDSFALVPNVVYKSSEEDDNDEVALFELGAEIHATEHLIIGPGVYVGLNDNEETPDWGAGIRLAYAF